MMSHRLLISFLGFDIWKASKLAGKKLWLKALLKSSMSLNLPNGNDNFTDRDNLSQTLKNIQTTLLFTNFIHLN